MSTVSQYIDKLESIHTFDDLRILMREILVEYGYHYYLYGLILPAEGATAMLMSFTNYSSPWLRKYTAGFMLTKDPHITHARNHCTPTLWSSLQSNRENTDFLNQASEYGLCDGVTIPFQSPGRALFCYAREHHSGDSSYPCDLVTLSLFLQERLHSMIPDYIDQNRQALTERELQVLELSTHEMSLTDISDTVGAPVSVIKFHFHSIRKKLSVLSAPMPIDDHHSDVITGYIGTKSGEHPHMIIM